jgi:hypothetical protein
MENGTAWDTVYGIACGGARERLYELRPFICTWGKRNWSALLQSVL